MKQYIKYLIILIVGLVLGGILYANRDIFYSPKCTDGTVPDSNGCCAGEVYTDMGMQGFNCCPEVGGDCFPPIK